MIRAMDEADAIRIANNSAYGLSSAGFTQTRWITMETQPGHFPI